MSPASRGPGVFAVGRHVRSLTEAESLEPGPDQRHVRGTGREQCERESAVHAFMGGLKDRSHGLEHPAILPGESRGFFFPGFTSH